MAVDLGVGEPRVKESERGGIMKNPKGGCVPIVSQRSLSSCSFLQSPKPELSGHASWATLLQEDSSQVRSKDTHRGLASKG